MSAAEHAPMPQPRSALKDEPSLPRRPSPDLLRPTPPPAAHPEPPKPREKTPEPEAKPPPETKAVSPSSTPEAEPEQDEPSSGELIDIDTFSQILELDEDEETHDFSRPMVWEYFEQAEKTFGEMADAYTAKDLNQLSALGHFLKGSSAALGLSRVQATCENIQHCGHRRDEVADRDLTVTEALQHADKLLKRVKVEYNEAQLWLKDFFVGDEAQ